jgi:4-hydroxy-3-methylbut-2-enyl diphosphate reductase
VARHHRAGRHVILIGHRGHAEIVGTLGQLPAGAASVVESAAEVAALPLAPDRPVAYAVQTTCSVDEAADAIAAVLARFADVAAPNGSDICYATTNRQAAIRAIAGRVDAVIVAGAHFSSNASRLAEVARAAGCPAVQLVDEAEALDLDALDGAAAIGLTAAASTPEESVRAILARLATRRALAVEEVGQGVEAVAFRPVRVDYPAMSLSGTEESASRVLS